MRCSALMWPMTGSTAALRLNSRLMLSLTRRFWPEICAHCGAAHPVIKLVLRHFGNPLRFVSRHFPLTQIPPHAEAAAETAEFAGASGNFWGMHDAIYENQHWLSLPLLLTLAETFGLSQSGLQEAVAARQYETQ